MERITVETTVNAPIEKAWQSWNTPEHIMKWNQASPDWHCPKSENDLRTGGSFTATMAAKDGSFSFDFGGIYDEVREHEYIAYHMSDGRKVDVTFTAKGNRTHISETFDPESENPIEMQKGGWQAILDSYTNYTASI